VNRPALRPVLALLVGLWAPGAALGARPHPAALDARLPDEELRALERLAVALANRDRAAHGLAPLAADPLLTEAARQHSDEMRDRGYFSHESPVSRYRTWVLRIARAGVTDATSGENIGTYGSNHHGATFEAFVATLQDNLMHSPPHRANLLNPGFNTVGIGLSIGESASASSPAVPLPAMWITQDFTGRRLRLDGAFARLVPAGLAVTLTGALAGSGARIVRVFLHPAAGEETSQPVALAAGRFTHTLVLPPGTGRVRIDLGVGARAGGRYEIANRLGVDTGARPEEAVGPWLEDE